MVLGRFAFIVFVFFGLAACERVPDWERKLRESGYELDARRMNELKKWIWSCRGTISRLNRENRTRWIGEDFESFLDYFRNRDLTVLDISGSKILVGSGIFWSSEHLVQISDDPQDLSQVECSNGASGWLPAELVSYDRFLSLGVWRVPGAKALLSPASRWTVPSEESAHPSVRLVAALLPGHLETMSVELQTVRSPLPISIDKELLLFLPTPPRVLREGLLFDDQWRLLGMVTPLDQSPWGLALKTSYLDRAVRDLISNGSVARPSLGFLVRYVADVGFVVQQVDVGGAAYDAGLRTNDLLLKMKERELKRLSDWEDISSADIGSPISITYSRDGKSFETQIRVRRAQ